MEESTVDSDPFGVRKLRPERLGSALILDHLPEVVWDCHVFLTHTAW